MKKTLIIEDNSNYRLALAATLKQLDYKVWTAETARAGLEIASQHKFDLIVIDYNLPDATADEVAVNLKGTHQFIFLTALDFSIPEFLDLPGEILQKPKTRGLLKKLLIEQLHQPLEEAI